MNRILDKRPKESLQEFLNMYTSIRDIPDNSYAMILDIIKFYKSHNKNPELIPLNHIKYIEDTWFAALDKNEIDYSVYGDVLYFMEVWACWSIYSRTYLRDMFKDVYISNLFKTNKSIIDLGCGIGYTTIALKEQYPHLEVYGTNLKDTEQWKFCKLLEQTNDINMIENHTELESVDIVFASEYFEHIISPISHLKSILKLSPKVLIISSSFGTRGIGHFYQYEHNGKMIHMKSINKIFNDTLRANGYTKQSTTLWNNTPNIWVKVEDTLNLF